MNELGTPFVTVSDASRAAAARAAARMMMLEKSQGIKVTPEQPSTYNYNEQEKAVK